MILPGLVMTFVLLPVLSPFESPALAPAGTRSAAYAEHVWLYPAASKHADNAAARHSSR